MTKSKKTKKPITLKLTLKQRNFLQEYFKTGNGVQSAMKIYDTEDYQTAAAIASENLKKLKPRINEMMEAKGISVGKLLDVLKDGLDASKVISATIVAGEQKEANSQTNDFIDVPDYPTRHKYLETAGRWLGVEKKDEPTVNVQVNNFIKKERDEFGI